MFIAASNGVDMWLLVITTDAGREGIRADDVLYEEEGIKAGMYRMSVRYWVKNDTCSIRG